MNKLERTLLEYDVARQNRQFEIQMFWQRSNYFLALNTALGVGFFAVEQQHYMPIISAIGLIASFLWYRTALGARYWQVFWEAEVHRLSIELGVSAFAKTDDEILAETVKFGRTKGKSKIRKFVDRQVSKKPSVSYNMILLSLNALVAWVLLNLFLILKYLMKLCECFNGV